MEEQIKDEQKPNPEEKPEEIPTPEELNATIERFKVTLAERDAEIAQLKGTIAEMHDAAAAQHAEAEEAAKAGKAVAEENEKLRSRIAELEAAKKDAETLAVEIAAEKYGAALPAKKDEEVIDVEALKAEMQRKAKEPGNALQVWVQSLSDKAYAALFKK